MHVMRLHIADLNLWSANDRRTGGKAVPIKEHCSDTAYECVIYGCDLSMSVCA